MLVLKAFKNKYDTINDTIKSEPRIKKFISNYAVNIGARKKKRLEKPGRKENRAKKNVNLNVPSMAEFKKLIRTIIKSNFNCLKNLFINEFVKYKKKRGYLTQKTTDELLITATKQNSHKPCTRE